MPRTDRRRRQRNQNQHLKILSQAWNSSAKRFVEEHQSILKDQQVVFDRIWLSSLGQPMSPNQLDEILAENRRISARINTLSQKLTQFVGKDAIKLRTAQEISRNILHDFKGESSNLKDVARLYQRKHGNDAFVKAWNLNK